MEQWLPMIWANFCKEMHNKKVECLQCIGHAIHPPFPPQWQRDVLRALRLKSNVTSSTLQASNWFFSSSKAWPTRCNAWRKYRNRYTHTNLIMSTKNSWLQNPNNMHCRITCTSTYITICAKQENKIKAMSVNIPFGSWLRSTEQNAPQLPSATLSSAHGRTHRSRAAILSWRRPG